MKGAPNRKKEQPKKEIETLQEPDLLESSTPEISARSRESLGMFAMNVYLYVLNLWAYKAMLNIKTSELTRPC